MTGDKTGTAINIGYSAKLLDKQVEVNRIESNDSVDIKADLDALMAKIDRGTYVSYGENQLQLGVVITGSALTVIKSKQNL